MSTDNKTEEQDVNTTYAADNEQTAENQEDAAAQDTQADASAEASELEKARVQAEENYQRLLRVQADFDNFRRRARAEKEDFAKYASLKLIEQLLPIVDNFDRALASSKETKDFDALAKGLDMTYRGMDQLLTAEGLKPIEAVGQPFNPEFHQAVMQVESDEHEEGIVVEELQKGYILKDKVIRPAMVKVSV
ncbi:MULTISPECIES: nucleotide exchange factor GrpE [Paenibacillus]|uniref:Protein GrpE n=1 Tax=Paenibacillus anseongense TaxID=2682845 RepID=A0ABW9UH89_9BACL|nr:MULTISPECIES: nucleotide exchange factor GrpE [Paenibacillus]MBA2938173.1 nucleotide exchange factor GrpE [Paenibacillus sp. CGMCC 1.16610]MVQ37230.1 nucleotide exchange factor GrpE [Paenibacillus anseongense]